MNYFFPVLLLSAVLLPSGGGAAAALENHAPHGGPGTNPLIEEMVVLDSVFCKIVSAVALGDGARAHKALESMHGAMEKTHEGVHAGMVRLPRNNDRMKEFINLDLKFHEKLESLAEAGEHNDQEKMLTLTKELLGRCVECHRMFRR